MDENIINKELWLEIVSALNFDSKHHDKVLTYIKNHYFIEEELVLGGSLPLTETTLPIALKVLSKLDLDKVDILTSPTENGTPCSSIVENVNVSNFDLDELLATGVDIEALLYSYFAETTVETINKLIEKNNKIQIYCLFLEIKKNDIEYRILHRLM
mgnify:CR=1 FL=1|jgi:hypothetical protein